MNLVWRPFPRMSSISLSARAVDSRGTPTPVVRKTCGCCAIRSCRTGGAIWQSSKVLLVRVARSKAQKSGAPLSPKCEQAHRLIPNLVPLETRASRGDAAPPPSEPCLIVISATAFHTSAAHSCRIVVALSALQYLIAASLTSAMHDRTGCHEEPHSVVDPR